jgi:hypothetical protein
VTPKQQLDEFIDRFTPEVASLARKAIARMRKLTPGALELVYDNYNALAIGFAAGEKMSETVLSIVLYPRWVSMFFFVGSQLKDPDKLLKGSGSLVRHVVLETPEMLDDPRVEALLAQVLRLSAPIDKKADNRIIIKSISAKQRPRRPAK